VDLHNSLHRSIFIHIFVLRAKMYRWIFNVHVNFVWDFLVLKLSSDIGPRMLPWYQFKRIKFKIFKNTMKKPWMFTTHVSTTPKKSRFKIEIYIEKQKVQINHEQCQKQIKSKWPKYDTISHLNFILFLHVYFEFRSELFRACQQICCQHSWLFPNFSDL